MFESIRKHSKIVMILLFLLIIPSFIFVGVNQNYFSESSATVARVDGHDIKQADWDNAHRVESDRLRAENPKIDGKLLDSAELRYATLEKMVRERVIAAAVQKLHLSASDEQLVRTLQTIPAIAELKKPDGSLDQDAYRALVGAQGMTPQAFEANLRYELSMGRVLGGVSSSAFATDAQVKLAMDALYQRREIQLAQFDAKSFAAKVQVSDADLKAYYEAHKSQFQQAEEASIEYIELNMASAEAAVVISEDDLHNYYKQNAERLAGSEERRVSHILIATSKDAPAADREKAKAKAEEILAEVRKDPKRFAEIAKTQSQDPGSASAGGDLGMIARGSMVKPFEDAAFSLKAGDISDVVETEFGYHILAVSEIKKPEAPSFESVRSKLQADLKKQQAQAKFAEMAEAFRDGVYEQSDSLKPVAEKFKLEIHKIEHVTRQPAADAQGPLANARFLEALFAHDALENKRNTDAVELAPGDLVAGRVLQYSPARTLTMEELGDKLRTAYVEQKSAELARAEGEARLAAWKNDSTGVQLGEAKTISREQAQDLPRQVLDAALGAPIASLPSWVGVDMGPAGYTVIKVAKVLPSTAPDAQVAEQQKMQYTQWLSLAEVMSYYEVLKKQFKVQIKVPHP